MPNIISDDNRPVTKIASRNPNYHILLCADQTKPKCCSHQSGVAAWEYLKERIQELGLDVNSHRETSCTALRSKVNCLRVCTDGPVMVVYPDGIWYRFCTPEVIERILIEHIMQGKPVLDFQFAESPLEGKKAAVE
jgi:(2Fe-2S) ferredoxin